MSAIDINQEEGSKEYDENGEHKIYEFKYHPSINVHKR
jgi:hypothetical protein